MTTTVTIDAHVSPDKEVLVTILDKDTEAVFEEFTLQDGESDSRYVYDDREIRISEITKRKE